jgi:hypothetical protein
LREGVLVFSFADPPREHFEIPYPFGWLAGTEQANRKAAAPGPGCRQVLHGKAELIIHLNRESAALRFDAELALGPSVLTVLNFLISESVGAIKPSEFFLRRWLKMISSPSGETTWPTFAVAPVNVPFQWDESPGKDTPAILRHQNMVFDARGRHVDHNQVRQTVVGYLWSADVFFE